MTWDALIGSALVKLVQPAEKEFRIQRLAFLLQNRKGEVSNISEKPRFGGASLCPPLAVSGHSNQAFSGPLNVRYWRERTFAQVGCPLSAPKLPFG